MAPRIARNVAIGAGALFLVLGAFSCVPNQVVGGEGCLLVSEPYQSIAHTVLGIYLLAMAWKGESSSAFGLFSSSVLCAAFGGVVIWRLGSAEVGYLADHLELVNRNAGYLHIGLAIALAVGGMLNTSRKQLFYQ